MEIQLAEVYSTLARRFDTAMPDDIDDAVASAHVATWQAHESGAELRNPDAFATCVAKRTLGRMVKSARRQVRPDVSDSFDWDAVATQQPRVTEDGRDNDTRLTIEEVLHSAPDNYAEVMRMHYLEGYTLEEAATKIGVTPECLRKRHERALKWARKKFAG